VFSPNAPKGTAPDMLTLPPTNQGNKDDGSAYLVEAAEVDSRELSAFLRRAFGPSMANFLMDQGDWWHRGPGGQVVAKCEGDIAGYRAIVPTACLFQGKEIPGVWAMHLYVGRQYRGRGLQRLLDQRLLEVPHLRMSFPNELGAKIYVKHGYGLREDLRRLLAPLRPTSFPRAQKASGGRGPLVKAAAVGLSPLAATLRVTASRYAPKRTKVVAEPDAETLEQIFRRNVSDEMATTLRSSEFLRWRYFDAPYREELVFYVTDSADEATHYGIVRYMPSGDSLKARVLDVFGDFQDEKGLIDLFRTIVHDAAKRHAVFVEMLVSSSSITRAARHAGFLLAEKRRFRWLADDPAVHEGFSGARLHWTMADGENDLPS